MNPKLTGTAKIKVISGFWYPVNGVMTSFDPGKVAEFPALFAMEMVSANKAEYVKEPPLAGEAKEESAPTKDAKKK